MNWRRVREVILTIDPARYPDPKESYEMMAKELGYFIQRLIAAGVEVVFYVRFLEWHRSGHPHYHVFIEVEKEGREGMITHALIQKLWEFGGVRELPIQNEDHWKKKIGYAGKTGYMGKAKKHQVAYPDWALDSHVRIRRVQSQLIKGQKVTAEVKTDEETLDDWLRANSLGSSEYGDVPPTVDPQPKKTNREAIEGCCQGIQVYFESKGKEMLYQGKINLPFDDWKTSGANYIKGFGWVKMMDYDEMILFKEKFNLRNPELADENELRRGQGGDAEKGIIFESGDQTTWTSATMRPGIQAIPGRCHGQPIDLETAKRLDKGKGKQYD